ncbi:MAG: magnesium transporter [Turicibacter sp.]|nr:magnesium transporter [Turicibacter sp.]
MAATKNFYIWKYLQERNIQSLKTALDQIEGHELVELFQSMDPEELVIAYRLLPKTRALQVFELLDVDLQEGLIHSFTEEKAIETFANLDPDDRVRLVEELPATVAKKLLSSLSLEERGMTDLLLGYELQTAGRIMTPEYIRLTTEMTVKQAMNKIRSYAKDIEAIYTMYITDEGRVLLGSVSLRNLLLADENTLVADIMKTEIPFAHTHDDQEDAARKLQNLSLMSLPVTDREMRLVGVITIDDALHILEEEATEDMHIQAGLNSSNSKESDRSRVLISGSLGQILKVRLPILMMVLASGFLSGFILEGFEDVLNSVTAIAFFIPLIMDMGGSIGGQSTTIFARGSVLGHIKPGKFLKQLGKESTVGLSIGVITGIFAFVAVTAWMGDPLIGLAVGLALVANCLLASFFGFLVPFFLIKIGADQAAGAGPIITSIKDITGLLTYFLLVSTLLTHLL